MFGIENEMMMILSVLAGFALTFVMLKAFAGKLPKDGGRAFAVDGKVAQGRPRGAGLIFIIVFAVVAVVLLPFQLETAIYLLLTVAAMVTGFLDDASANPWSEYKKGLLDLILAGLLTWTYYNFNGSTISIPFVADPITLHPVLFFVLSIILVWASINVTNCTDGVDGLSGTLGIITLGGIYFMLEVVSPTFAPVVLVMISVIVAYLWFNANPNVMMMGDAGSRAIGFFIAIAILKTGNPILFIPLALLFIIDGGLGLIKVSLLRFLKIKILANTRTPIHDHMRKNKGWSNTQVVFRFAILQLVLSFVTVTWWLSTTTVG